jgi:hypothetical protein
MRGRKKEIIDKDKEVLLKEEIKSLKKENRSLRQTIGRIEASRNAWRSKYQDEGLKKENRLLRQQVKRLEKSRNHWYNQYQRLKKAGSFGTNGWALKVKKHQFSVGMIKLVLLLSVYGGMSLRSCRHSLSCILVSLGFVLRVPSHVTIRNWQCKHGYGRLEASKQGDTGSEKGKYVLIIDESMIIGGQKLLLVLGKKHSESVMEAPPAVCEMKVFYLGLSKSWTKKTVSAVLSDLKTLYEISHVVSDGSTTLLSSIEASGLVSVRDCSHAYAGALQRQYETDEHFLKLRDWSSMMRQKWCMTPHHAFLPPKLRVKSRFMNLFHWIEWGHRTLTQSIEGTPWQKELQAEYIELLSFQPLITELEYLRQQTVACFQILKSQGASHETLPKVQACIQDNKALKVIAFNAEIRAYLKKIQTVVPQKETFLCCSDVIESTFGKFKAKLERQPRKSLTQFILNIANFDTQFDDAQIQSIFEKYTLQDVQQWFDDQK